MASLNRLQELLETAVQALDQAGKEIRAQNFSPERNLERILDSLASICAIQDEIRRQKESRQDPAGRD